MGLKCVATGSSHSISGRVAGSFAAKMDGSPTTALWNHGVGDANISDDV